MVGAYALTAFPARAATTRQALEYQEQNLKVTLNQLWGRDWAMGATYRLSDADFHLRLPEIPTGPAVDQRSTLDQATIYALVNHPRGFFARAESLWTTQRNRGTDHRPGDAFWQFNTWIGYRFPRRCAEVRFGVLNWADRDYQLNPINLYAFLPRERTYTLSLRFNF